VRPLDVLRVLRHEEVELVFGVQGEDIGEADALAPREEGVHAEHGARFLLDGRQLAPELRTAPGGAELPIYMLIHSTHCTSPNLFN
jgi:hypothetical protein